jgi:CelD/BcsL family acetyltransferase involved in cellulose biosynthesis
MAAEPALTSSRREGGAFRVTVARTLEEVEALREIWTRLQGAQFNTDIDVFLTTASLHPAIARPHVILVERTGTPETLIVGNLGDVPLFGLRRCAGPSVRALRVAGGGFLGNPSAAAVAVGVREINRSVALGDATIGVFRLVAPGSLQHQVLLEEVPPRRRQCGGLMPHAVLDLESTLEDTLRGRGPKTRENLRRAMRRTEAMLGDRASIRIFRDPAEAEEFFAYVDAVAPRTHQYRESLLYGESEAERDLVKLGFERGWFRGYVLLVDGEPGAFWTGFGYKGVFGWRGRTGYDPRLSRYEPGTVLLLHLLDDLSRDPDIHMFDFGQGAEAYKRRLATRATLVGDVRIYARNPRSTLVQAVGAAASIGRRMMGRGPSEAAGFVPALTVPPRRPSHQ